jgi:hypothetical protein
MNTLLHFVSSGNRIEVSPERPMLRRVCGWCRADMGSKPCDPSVAGKISHGMCPACEAVAIASIPSLRRPA